MAKKKKKKKLAVSKPIEIYKHKNKRKNNPHVGGVTSKRESPKVKAKKYQYDPYLDPQLQWAGKAEWTSFEVPSVSLHVHERIGGHWFRVDLVFYHRFLKCLVIIDLKVGNFTHADAGQMNVYLNYAKRHWMRKGENPPVGLILCAGKNDVLVQYALEGMSGKILTAKYTKELPSVKLFTQEVEKTRKILENRKKFKKKGKYSLKGRKK